MHFKIYVKLRKFTEFSFLLKKFCKSQIQKRSERLLNLEIPENQDYPDLIRDKLELLLDRQTGEEFQSDGPPDCRVVRLENCPKRKK